MSEQAPIDGLNFAREGGRLQGELAVASMPRLEDVVVEQSGTVRYAIAGSVNAHGRPVLDVRTEATLPLVCQRCLARVDYKLQRTSRFLLVESEKNLPDVAEEDPNIETIPADALTDVPDVIEQEVLLGLPIAPMHPRGACEGFLELPRDDKPSPFAVLERLKKSRPG
jgi:uncharacterized protein